MRVTKLFELPVNAVSKNIPKAIRFPSCYTRL